VANILQVAYYRGPLVTRARMLESRGHQVTSVLGNDEAFGLDAAVIAAADSIVASSDNSPFFPEAAIRSFSMTTVPSGLVSELSDIHRLAVGRRSSGFCDGRAASTKKSLIVLLTVRGNRSA
jgi:hypothetical protein